MKTSMKKMVFIINLVFAIGAMTFVQPMTAGAIESLDLDANEKTIPYTQFWAMYTRNGSNDAYYLRSSNTYNFLYTGTQLTSVSSSSAHPTNWRLIQQGSYRLLKNSSTGLCVWVDILSAGGTTTKMTTCDGGNSHQRFYMNYSTINGVNRVRMMYSESGQSTRGLVPGFNSAPGAYDEVRLNPQAGDPHGLEYWYYKNPR